LSNNWCQVLNFELFNADNSKITTLENFKTGLLTELRLFNNLLTGVLDLSNVPVSGLFYTFSNPDLTSIIFAASGNAPITSFRSESCDITGDLDFQNIPSLTGLFYIYGNANLTGILNLNWTGSNFRCYNCDIDDFDLTNVNFSLTSSSLNMRNNNLTDLVGLKTHLGTNFFTWGNPWVGPIDFQYLTFNGTNITEFRTKTTLLGINNLSGTLGNIDFGGCKNCGYIDFSNITDIGTSIQLDDMGMDSTDVDNTIIRIDQIATAQSIINGTLKIILNNAARTSASDTAYNNLIANGWSIT